MAVAAASDLNSVESSYSVGTSGMHSWEQSVDPYDPTGHGSRPVRSKKDLKPHEYDSLDYEMYNYPYQQMIRSYRKWTYLHITFMRWLLVGMIGCVTGLVAFAVNYGIEKLLQLKHDQLNKVYFPLSGGSAMYGLLVLLGFNSLFVLISAGLVVLEPVASGSGVTEIKCYLNGVKIPHVARISALLVKMFGVMLSVSAGLLVGQEGPLVYIGAVLGAGISQLRSLVPGVRRLSIPYPYFRSDREKRDFVSCGAAAGLAAAFGAPIGGTLFSLEESSSFWNQALSWRTLFCCFTATFTFNFLMAGKENRWLVLGDSGIVNFGQIDLDDANWTPSNLLVFGAMGVGGGLLGAVFNCLHSRVVVHRMTYLQRRNGSKFWRIAEVLLVTVVTTVVMYSSGMTVASCLPMKDLNNVTNSSYANETNHLFCPTTGNIVSGPRYLNDITTLFLNSQEVSVKLLFHLRRCFALQSLGTALILSFLLACWTLGSAVPSGLFIPCIFIGALYGRFISSFFEWGYLSSTGPFAISVGTYSVIGAASFLSGVMRMTISLTIIMMEATRQISYGIPILIAVSIAKLVGDLFNKGIYEIQIELKKTPFLEWEGPGQMERLLASDVMSSPLSYIHPITRVKSIVTLLESTTFSAFPVVTHILELPNVCDNNSFIPRLYDLNWQQLEREGHLQVNSTQLKGTGGSVSPQSERTSLLTGAAKKHNYSLAFQKKRNDENWNWVQVTSKKPIALRGIILRSQLITLLKRKVFFSENTKPESQPCLTHDEMNADYPRFGSIADVHLTSDDREMLMDVTRYMNPCPYTISGRAPLPQVFNLFRTMGLRHLPVVDTTSGKLLGIITRHDLCHENLQHLFQAKNVDRTL